jgi:hypothetical protein
MSNHIAKLLLGANPLLLGCNRLLLGANRLSANPPYPP